MTLAIPVPRLGPAVLPRLRLRRGAALVAVAAILAAAGAAPGLRASPAGFDAKVDPALTARALARPEAPLSVIVREADPSTSRAEALVRSLDGTVTRELPMVGSFSGRLPAGSLARLAASSSVLHVWGDARIRMSGLGDDGTGNTVWRKAIGMQSVQNKYQGDGVTVGLIDTGVAQVADLGSRVLARVDFTPDRDGIDRFGHGTHMAGLIAGDGTGSNGTWMGVAPRANIVSVKVAGADGATDVSVVIAGLQWIYSHKAQYNIRVLNLSFGTDARQTYLLDPLDYAVEQVWSSGILVVVSAGNRGPAPGSISKPGDDPLVLTVGAADLRNSNPKNDDVVTPFSAVGPTQDAVAKPDLVAPGTSMVSSRVPGSSIDSAFPNARVGDNNFRGTGTSQATAVVSGVAALLFQANPSITPEVAKAVLTGTADKSMTLQPGAGAGLIDAQAATKKNAVDPYLSHPANLGVTLSTGKGSLEGSRGTMHVYANVHRKGMELVTGEMDAMGNSWDGNSWSISWLGNSWEGNSWSMVIFDGNSWGGNSWDGVSWDGNTWDGNTWDGNAWGSNAWETNSWS